MSEQTVNDFSITNGKPADEEIHFLDVLIIMAQQKRLVIGLPLLTGTLALVASLFMSPSFTSTTKLMPPQQQSSSGVAAMLGSLGGLAGAAGGIAGLKNPNDLYIGLLESRTVADRLVTRFKLQQRYQVERISDARRILASATEVVGSNKDGFISITTSDTNPQFAAQLANGYAEELMLLTKSMALTEASQRRLFFEKQLQAARDDLASAEVALRTTQEKTGMLKPDAQVQLIIANVAQLRGTIAAKEVELRAMRTFATGQNPDLLRTQEELRGLQLQLARLQDSSSGKGGDFMVSTGKIPEVGVEYVRSARNVKYYETIFELLAKQYELAKIDEAKDSTAIQVLDTAIPADRKSKPSRVKVTLAGAMAGALLGLIIAFLRSLYTRSRINPASAGRWQTLSAAWKGRKTAAVVP
jgi:uncharacterized protein involved in exopolysaccharide biosynthesis